LHQAAPEERPEISIRFAEMSKCNRLFCGLRLLSPSDCPLAEGDGLLSAAADFRPAGNILSILLIMSKNLGESICYAEYTCSNYLPTQNSEEPFKYSNYSGARSKNKKETCVGYGDTLPVSSLKKSVSCGRLHCFYSGFWLLDSEFCILTPEQLSF